MADLSSATIFGLTVTSFAGWSALYGLVCKALPHRSYEWNCRLVVLIHALTILTLSTMFGALYNPWPFTHPGGESNIYEISTMITCLGYFLFDFCWCVWFYDEETRIMIVHHLVSIVGLVASLSTGLSGTEIGACIFLAEVTNPMLQARWFMRSSGRKGGALYELNDFLFLATFALCRGGVGTYFLYRHASHPLPKPFFKFGGLALYLVSMVLLTQILAFAYHKYTRLFLEWRSGHATNVATKSK